MVGIKKLNDTAFEGMVSGDKILPSALPTLQRLNLEMCDHVSDRLLAMIKVKHPRILIYNYYKDEITADLL